MLRNVVRKSAPALRHRGVGSAASAVTPNRIFISRNSIRLLPAEISPVEEPRRHTHSIRSFSSTDGGSENAKEADKSSSAIEDETSKRDEKELPIQEEGNTAQTVATLLLLAGIVVGVGYTAYQLFPGKLSPHNMFSQAFDELQQNSRVKNIYGEPLKAYAAYNTRLSRQHNVEHEEYVSADDNSKRMRIRFNIEGPYGVGIVFAERSSSMPTKSWVYLMVQNINSGQVLTVADERALIAVGSSTSTSEEANALKKLLGGS